MPDKGKPFERMGRKATGLHSASRWDKVAGLPGEGQHFQKLYIARCNGKGSVVLMIHLRNQKGISGGYILPGVPFYFLLGE
jgi:hypothetical protein